MRFLFFLLVPCLLKSQDTLYFMNKKKEAGNVLEIDVDVVRYKRFDNLEGPLFIKYKTEIDSILFKNGETLKLGPGSGKTAAPAADGRLKPLTLEGNVMYYKNDVLSEGKLKKLILSYPDAAKQRSLMVKFNDMRTFKKIHHTWAIAGPITSGVIVMTASFIGLAEAFDPLPYLVVGFAAGGGCLVLSLNMTRVYKQRLIQQKKLIVAQYNNF